MKLYCFVVHNAVEQGPASLSLDLQNKSDFELLALGWYYAECVRPGTFVDRTEVFLPVQFDVQPTKVVCTFTKREKTQAELDSQNAEKQTEIEQDKANRLAFAATFMASPEYSALPTSIQTQWPPYVQTVTDTVTQGLGDAIWDVGFPSPPPTENAPVPPVPPEPMLADV
jgi:hypothetical protein